MKPSRLAFADSVPMNFELAATIVSANSWTNSLCCPHCQVSLNLHQPDEEQPSQLLGTCEDCARWFFVVESELDWEGTLLFELPSAEKIRTSLARSTTR